MIRTMVVSIGLVLLSSPTFAVISCFDPPEPSCVNPILDTQLNGIAFTLCRSEVEKYIRMLTDYAECSHIHAKQKADEAVEFLDCLVEGGQMVGQMNICVK